MKSNEILFFFQVLLQGGDCTAVTVLQSMEVSGEFCSLP